MTVGRVRRPAGPAAQPPGRQPRPAGACGAGRSAVRRRVQGGWRVEQLNGPPTTGVRASEREEEETRPPVCSPQYPGQPLLPGGARRLCSAARTPRASCTCCNSGYASALLCKRSCTARPPLAAQRRCSSNGRPPPGRLRSRGNPWRSWRPWTACWQRVSEVMMPHPAHEQPLSRLSHVGQLSRHTHQKPTQPQAG